IPSWSVVGDAPVTLPPPEATAKATGTPGIRFWNWSRTTTDGDVPTAVPAGAVWPSPACTDTCAGPPGNAVALKTAKVSASPVTLSTARASTRWISEALVTRVHRYCAAQIAFDRMDPRIPVD